MLAAPIGNPAGVELPDAGGRPSLADLLEVDDVLAVCAPEVPCGAAAAEVLDRAGLARRARHVRGRRPGGPDQGAARRGRRRTGLPQRRPRRRRRIGARASTFREAELAVNDYPIAGLGEAGNPAAAAAFVELVLSEAGQRVLTDAGFLPPE